MGPKSSASFLWLLAHCCLALPTAAAPDVVLPTSPFLRLENGGHSAPIMAMSADTACRYVATASTDKLVRVWEAATGKALTVLRPPVGDGGEGELFAVAVSLDGSTIGCGGETDYGAGGASVFLFDRATGRIARRITGPHGVVHALAFSRDGKYLAVGTGDSGGLSVYRSTDGHLVGEDGGHYGTIGSIQVAVVDNEGAPVRLAAASTEGVHLYKFLEGAATPLREVAQAGHLGATPDRLAFSPDGKSIALGFLDAACVLILTGDDLTPGDIYRVSRRDDGEDKHNLMSVCWSADGRQVFGAGDAGDKAEESTIYRWTVGRTDSPTRMSAGALQVTGLLCPPQGGLLFSAMTLPLGSFDSNGRRGRRSLFHAFPLTRNGSDGALLVSADGATVPLPTGPAGRTVRFSLRDHALQPVGAAPIGLQAPITVRPGVAVRDGDERTAPTLNGVDIPLAPFETPHCHAIAPDEQSFILGTSHTLQCFSQDLDQLWVRALPSQAWKVNVSGQGRVAVAALGDGTVRWFRMTDGAELCAFSPDDDLKRWVAWTPSYDYDASPGGENLFGWHVNHGLDRAADFLPGSRFRDAHFRPARVAGALETSRPVEAGPPAPDAAPEPTGVTPAESSEVTPSPTTPPRVTVLDAPGQVRGTIATCVDSQGKILLTSFDRELRPRSLLFSQGVYSEIGPFERRNKASVLGFNQQGQFVGVDYDSTRHSHGFIVTNGVRTRLDAPKGLLGTWPSGINNRGQVTGHYFDQSNRSHGFLWSGGAFTTLDMPGATGGTCAVGINDQGQVVGHFNDKTGRHGFVLSHGVYKTLIAPLGPHNTDATGINARGDIVGSYEDESGRARGFLLRHGVYKTLDFSAAVHDFLPVSISDNGRVVGYYKDENDQRHGFVMTP